MKPFLIARMALTLGASAALLIAIVVLSLVPAHDRPVTALPHSLEHLTSYGQTTRLSFVACESMGNAKVPSGRGQIRFSSTILMSVASTS